MRRKLAACPRQATVLPARQARAAPPCAIANPVTAAKLGSLQIGAHSVVDLTAQEELCSSASVQVAVDESGAVCGLTKRRQKGVDPSVALVSSKGQQPVWVVLGVLVDSGGSAADRGGPKRGAGELRAAG